MTHYFYIAVMERHENGGLFSWVDKVSESDDISRRYSGKDVVAANLLPTKKRANEVSDLWDKSFHDNGTHFLCVANSTESE